MTETTDATAFIPPQHRRRMDRPQLRDVNRPQGVATIETITPMSEDIARDSLRFHTMVQNTIKERNVFADQLNQERARVEQFQISLNQRDSTIEQLTLERDGARESCIRFQAILENLGNTIADSLGQVAEPEADRA